MKSPREGREQAVSSTLQQRCGDRGGPKKSGKPASYPQGVATTDPRHALSARAWPGRFLRSLAASYLGLIIAVGGHRFGGGEIASATVICAVFAIVFAATLLLSARQLTIGQIVGLLVVAQVVVHTGCVFGGPMTAFGPAMVAGHLLATAIATWVLVRGERFLWTMADRLALHALRLILSPLVVPGPVTRLRFVRQELRLPLRLVLVGGKALRGPPVGFAQP